MNISSPLVRRAFTMYMIFCLTLAVPPLLDVLLYDPSVEKIRSWFQLTWKVVLSIPIIIGFAYLVKTMLTRSTS